MPLRDSDIRMNAPITVRNKQPIHLGVRVISLQGTLPRPLPRQAWRHTLLRVRGGAGHACGTCAMCVFITAMRSPGFPGARAQQEDARPGGLATGPAASLVPCVPA